MTIICNAWSKPSAEQVEHALNVLERSKPYVNGYAAQSLIQIFVPMMRTALLPPTDHEHFYIGLRGHAYCIQCGWTKVVLDSRRKP